MTRAEWEAAGTSSPTVRLWGESGGEAAGAYARTFRLSPGQNILVRQVAEPEDAQLYSITGQGLKRLNPGGVK